MNARQVGHIEINRQRIYPLDPDATNEDRTTVVVEPGTYPLFQDGGAYFWVMTGRINARGVTRLGDGLFVVSPNDEAAGPEVQFPSPRFGEQELADLLTDPTFTSRCRVVIDAPGGAA